MVVTNLIMDTRDQFKGLCQVNLCLVNHRLHLIKLQNMTCYKALKCCPAPPGHFDAAPVSIDRHLQGLLTFWSPALHLAVQYKVSERTFEFKTDDLDPTSYWQESSACLKGGEVEWGGEKQINWRRDEMFIAVGINNLFFCISHIYSWSSVQCLRVFITNKMKRQQQ